MVEPLYKMGLGGLHHPELNGMAQWLRAGGGGQLHPQLIAQQPHRHELWLDHAHTGLGDLETRLSRLTAWVLQADRLGLDYGLRLPGKEIAMGHGAAQRRRCLEALALC